MDERLLFPNKKTQDPDPRQMALFAPAQTFAQHCDECAACRNPRFMCLRGRELLDAEIDELGPKDGAA